MIETLIGGDRPYRYSALRGQFIAADRKLSTLPIDWVVSSIGDWHLYRHPDSYLQEIHLQGSQVGWLVGIAWDGNKLVKSAIASASEEALLQKLDDLGGMFAAVCPGRFVRHDAMGQQSIVFCTDSKAVATNPLLIKAACGGELDQELVTLMNIPNEDRWYPFGLTPVQGVRRLLPNHRLNLKDWQPVRYWPLPEDIEGRDFALGEAAEITRRRVKDGIQALASRYPLQMGLTAGHDSRLILACSRPYIDRMITATNIMHPKTGKIDHIVARKLSRTVGVPHEIRKPRKASNDEKLDFIDQTGLSAAGARFHHIALMNAFDETRAFLYGHGGEMLRGFYFNRFGTSDLSSPARLDSSRALGLAKAPDHHRLRTSFESWQASLPEMRLRHLLSIFYHEQRLGCWAASLHMSGICTARTVWVFAHRDFARLSLRLSPDVQRSSSVLKEVIRLEWPELLRVPFNHIPPPVWRRVAGGLKRLVARDG